jgi:signal transduction histidine kinase
MLKHGVKRVKTRAEAGQTNLSARHKAPGQPPLPKNRIDPIASNPAANTPEISESFSDWLISGVVVIDSHRQVVHVTDQAARVLGMETIHSFEMLPPELQRLAAKTSSTGKPISNRQVRLTIAGHAPQTLVVSVLPLGPAGTPHNIALVITQSNSTNLMEEGCRQLDRLANIGVLSTGLAHEIRNSLVASKTFIDLLLEQHHDAEMVSLVRRELDRIDTIVNQMLRFSGPTRGEFGQVHLHEILDHSLRLVQHQLDQKGIKLTRAYGATPDLLSADDSQLEQAFVNLFLNAVEATGPHGALTITTDLALPKKKAARAATSPEFHITIQDTGSGVAPQNLDRLFTPFFTTKPHGTGLGLPITRRIIEEHSGAITVQSALNKGACFQIVLPGPTGHA